MTIAFISACASDKNSSVLTAVQLLWVNLIMDSLGALCLATDPPTDDILNRMPESKLDPLINAAMWKQIIGQSIFQVFAILFVLYASPSIFNIDKSNVDQEN